ncbi:hypothetical protein NJG16_05400 [Stenotrophomonas maltophilia]|nr:hypothetical protein [Stenotrophomonas maltophilia]
MSPKMLSRMTEVTTRSGQDEVNSLLSEGWRLLSVESVPVEEGADSWVKTKYVLGYPGQDALED